MRLSEESPRPSNERKRWTFADDHAPSHGGVFTCRWAVHRSSRIAPPSTSTHHRIKTHADSDVRQPWPGIYLWRDPYGRHYLVDHTGTRRLTNAA